MKITAILLTLACLQLSAEGYSQVITISVKNAPLEKVLKEINRQTGYNFLYSDQDLQKARPVSLDVKGVTLKTVLELCFKDQLLDYIISDNDRIVIVRSRGDNVNAPVRGESKDDLIDVKGRVLNEKGEPVEGATVTVKGTGNATATDINGVFKLNGVDPNAILVLSGVNVETYEVKLKGRNDLATINLKTKIAVGDEVLINTGYQKLNPNEVTGSVVQLNNAQLNRTASTDILSRLQGITSGLLFISGLGNYTDQDQRQNILIRGYTTILSNKQPLIVIDNFPYEGDINSINPNDIESITILKDAAAASIWGTRAGNGVIVLTTKKGKYNQRPKVTFNSSFSIIEKPDLFYAPIMNASDYIDVEIFLFSKGKYAADISSSFRPALTPAVEILLKRMKGQISAADSATQLDALRKLDVRNDLTKYYLKKPVAQQYAVSIAGGSTDQQYFFSAGYDHNRNISVDYNRITLNAVNTYSLINHKLEFTAGVWAAQTKSTSFPAPNVSNYVYAQIADAIGNPLPIALHRQGYIDTAGGGKLLDWNYYPLKEINMVDDKLARFSYSINTGIKYKIIKGLEVEVKYKNEKQQMDIRTFHSLETYYTRDYINQFSSINSITGVVTRPVPLGGILDQRTGAIVSQNFRGQLNYTASWQHQDRLTVIAGAEISDATTKTNGYRSYGYDEDKGTSIPVNYGALYNNYINNNPGNIAYRQFTDGQSIRAISAYGNAAYSYKGKYGLSASARRDGSNLFGATTNNKWKPLWSVGGSWEISKEAFYHLGWLPRLKLRVTYGFQGNVNSSAVALLTIGYSGLTDRWNLPFSQIRTPPNPDLRWEKVGKFNAALDYAFINSRISGSIEVFLKNSTDLLGDKLLPPSSGPPSGIKTNSADMKGGGIDIIVNTQNLTGKIKWFSSFLFSYARDRVTDYKLVSSTISSYIDGRLAMVGKPVNSLFSFKWAGLDPATGDPQGYLNGHVSKNYTELIYSPNLNDLVYNGPTTPPCFGGLLNTFSLKGISLSFNITYKFGYYFRRHSIDYDQLFSGLDQGNTDYLIRWKKPGDEKITNVPSLVYPSNSGPATNRDMFYRNSEVLVEKGDHIRLQDVRLEYDLNRLQFRKLPFQHLSLYLAASNLGILWKANKAGADPDYPYENSYRLSLPGKAITGGVKVEF